MIGLTQVVKYISVPHKVQTRYQQFLIFINRVHKVKVSTSFTVYINIRCLDALTVSDVAIRSTKCKPATTSFRCNSDDSSVVENLLLLGLKKKRRRLTNLKSK